MPESYCIDHIKFYLGQKSQYQVRDRGLLLKRLDRTDLDPGLSGQ